WYGGLDILTNIVAHRIVTSNTGWSCRRDSQTASEQPVPPERRAGSGSTSVTEARPLGVTYLRFGSFQYISTHVRFVCVASPVWLRDAT
ncbi:MAG: hypothetical protein ACRDHW_06235, partial [Ktedonobacteraceae bacterium]